MILLSLIKLNYRLNIHTAFEDNLYRAYHINEHLLRAQIVFMYDHPTIQSIINQTKEIGQDLFKYLIKESEYETSLKELANKRNIVKEEFIRILATILLNSLSNKLKNDK